MEYYIRETSLGTSVSEETIRIGRSRNIKAILEMLYKQIVSLENQDSEKWELWIGSGFSFKSFCIKMLGRDEIIFPVSLDYWGV